MEERNIFIVPLTLLWYLSNFFERLRKQRVTSIICLGKLELLADVMGVVSLPHSRPLVVLVPG